MTDRGASALRIPLAIVIGLLVALAAVGGQPAQAANIAVNTTDDELNSDGDCSLREAITAANTDAATDTCVAGSGADTITLPAGTYILTIAGTGENAAATGDLDITDDVTIVGAGAAASIIDGGALDRVFDVIGTPAVDMSSLTIRNGASPGDGGGMYNRGTLTLTDLTVSGNTANSGAGIASEGGAVSLTNGTVSGNTANFDGAGIAIWAGGALTLTGSTVAGNTASDFAGGIANSDGSPVTLTDSTVSGNTAGECGGGLDNWDSALTLTDSTVSGNTADGTGGGICSEGGPVTLTNTTVSGNSAASGGGIDFLDDALTLVDSTISGNTASDGTGGGIGNFDGTVVLTNSTISGNTTSVDGGGIHNCGTATLTNTTVSGNDAAGVGGGIFEGCFDTLNLTNVTIADNTATSGGGIAVEAATGGSAALENTIVADNTGGDCTGTDAITSGGHNLDSDGSCGLGAAGDLPSTDPQLGPLVDNGGDTLTHALPAGSPAIDAGDNAACPATDQRGVARPLDGNVDGTATCDIGAYEYEPSVTPTPTSTPTATPTATPAELPLTGGEPGSGGGAWTLAIVLLTAGVLALAGAGGALVVARRRR
jgi:CSLREA domain-containing protein